MDPEAGSTMELAALGRPFGLGMLYDCRQDSLVPGMTLWDRDDLEKETRERPKPNSDFEIVASESIEDKSSALNVQASLKASFLGGLIEVEGSAKYLNDQRTSSNQARVTLKYKTTTKFQELSMNHLGRGNVKHPYVFDQGIATHVVTGILYGAQAFFVFDREVSQTENHQDIQGNLKVVIKKIPLLAIEGEGSLKMEDKDKANVDRFSCKFHGDFCLQNTPTSFQDAIEVYRSLPKLLGANGENAVPMKVWLLPLTTLDSAAAKLVRQISIRLVQEAQSVLEDFSELEMRCNDSMRSATAQQFPQIRKNLKSFKEMCSEFRLEFQRTLARKLPRIRGGGEEESDLAAILKKRHSSPFSSKNLTEWMDCKEKEIIFLKTFTNMMKSTKVISSDTGLFEEVLSVEHALCFVFTSLGGAEPYLSALSNYLTGAAKPEDLNPHTHDIERDQWYLSKQVADHMRTKAKLFSDFADANRDNKKVKFLTVGLTNDTHKGSSIYLYEGGFPKTENFEPPSKPETVTAADINHNSVTLKISPPRFGAENITSYSVEYCVSGEEEWQQKTESKAEEVTVRGLRPNTEYVFRCRAATSVGVGPATIVSESIKTLPCSPPGECSITCHYPCGIKNDHEKHGCASMNNGMCTVCPEKCVWNVHFNQTYQWEYVPVKEKQTLQELKSKYERATKEKMTVQQLIERQEEEIVKLQDLIVNLMDQSACCISHLQEIALRPNPLTTPEYIDMMIEGEKSEAKPGYQARIHSLEGMRERAKLISKVAQRDRLTKTDDELLQEREEKKEKKGLMKKISDFYGFE